MTTRLPELLVGMPVFNGERYLRTALDSLLGQTFSDFELLVSDNASTDGSPEILAEYARRDSRVRVVRQPTTTTPHENFLCLLRQARSPLFMWAAHDDEWAPEFMQLHVEAHRRDPTLALAFCHYHYTDPDGHPIGPMRAPDYVGTTVTERLSKLCRFWDDSVFYGVFRRSAMDGLELPVWWPPNDRCPINVAYPPLVYVLARGGYALVGSRALWFNRTHSSKSYSDTVFESDVARELAAYLLRTVNVEYEVLRQAYRGSGSMIEAARVLPPLSARLSWLTTWHLAYTGYTTGRSLVRRARGR